MACSCEPCFPCRSVWLLLALGLPKHLWCVLASGNSCITFCLAACPSHVSRIHPLYVQSTHILRIKNLTQCKKHQIGKYSCTSVIQNIQILYGSYMSIHVLISRCPERAQPETWDDLLSFSPELKSNPVTSIVYLFEFVSALVCDLSNQGRTLECFYLRAFILNLGMSFTHIVVLIAD